MQAMSSVLALSAKQSKFGACYFFCFICYRKNTTITLAKTRKNKEAFEI